MSTRKLLISGEAPDIWPRGYRSRRLSTSAPYSPPTKEEAVFEEKPRQWRWTYLRYAFNIMVCALIWIYAIAPHYHLLLSPWESTKETPMETIVLPPTPPPAPDHRVMSEIEGVKQHISELEAAISKTVANQAVDSQLSARDAELDKMHQVVRDLTQRLDSMAAEARDAAATTTTTTSTTTTTPPPTTTRTKQVLLPQETNVANEKLGAFIWRERTSYTIQPTWTRWLQPLIEWSPRYRGLQKPADVLNKPETVLDEIPVRGYGDAYCLQGVESMHIGIVMAYGAVKVSAFEIHHVQPNLDIQPSMRPRSVKVESLSPMGWPLKPIQASLQFDEHGRARLPVSFEHPTQRLVFTFPGTESGVCVYRIKVFGKFSKASGA